jgi:hypothetical protein
MIQTFLLLPNFGEVDHLVYLYNSIRLKHHRLSVAVAFGANRTIVSYNASAIKICNATSAFYIVKML